MVILFDFDGTLADTTSIQLEIVRDIFINKYGYRYSIKEQQDLLKLFRDKGPFPVLLKIKFSIFRYPELLKEIKARQKIKIKNLKISPEMKTAVTSIRKFAQIGILSAGNAEYVRPFLAKGDLQNYFDYIYTDDHTRGKEKLFKRFLEETRINPKDIVYIGDELQDVKISKKFGVKVIAVTWGMNSKKGLSELKPNKVADTPQDIVDYLKSII